MLSLKCTPNAHCAQIDWDKYKKNEGIEEELDQYRKVSSCPRIWSCSGERASQLISRCNQLSHGLCWHSRANPNTVQDGYIEKMSFLQRSDARLDEILRQERQQERDARKPTSGPSMD